MLGGSWRQWPPANWWCCGHGCLLVRRGRGLGVSGGRRKSIAAPSIDNTVCAQYLNGCIDLGCFGGPEIVEPGAPRTPPPCFHRKNIALTSIPPQVFDRPLGRLTGDVTLGVKYVAVGDLQGARLRPFLVLVKHFHLEARLSDQRRAGTVDWTLIGRITRNTRVESPVDGAGLAIRV